MVEFMNRLRQHLPRPFIILGFLFFIQWLLLFNAQQGIWDGSFYYAFARSIAFDGDLQISNDLVLSYPTAPSVIVEKDFHLDLTETGRVHSPFAIGSSFIWAIWLGILRAGNALVQLFGLGWKNATGYEWVFVTGIGAFSALLGWLAFWLAYRLASAETSKTAALWSAATLLFATPMLYYQFREPFYSHATAALTTTLCIYVWWRGLDRKRTVASGIVLGALIGVSSLVRWQNLIYLALPGISALWSFLQLPVSERRRQWQSSLVYLAAIGVTALLIFSLQMGIWRVFYGSWITVPQGSAYVDWSAPNLLPTLFSSYRGLLPWLPAIIPAFVGLGWLARRRPKLIVPLLVIVVLEVYINGSTRDWFGGGGYGPRRYTSELAIIVLGYAAFIQLLWQRQGARLTQAIAALLALLLGLQQWVLLRFGIPEQIGGSHSSMYPTYNWSDVSLTTFLGQIGERLPRLFRQPIDGFVFPNSPLDWLINKGEFPLPHLAGLLLAATFLALIWAFRPWDRLSARGRPWLFVVMGLTLLLLQLWIGFLA